MYQAIFKENLNSLLKGCQRKKNYTFTKLTKLLNTNFLVIVIQFADAAHNFTAHQRVAHSQLDNETSSDSQNVRLKNRSVRNKELLRSVR